MKEKIIRMLAIWTVGLAECIIFCLLLIFGRVRIFGYSYLLRIIMRKILGKEKRGLVLYFRHPSLFEPIIIPSLFFPFSFIFPSLIPCSFPAKENYYDKKWYIPFRPFSEPVERGDYEKALKLLKKMRDMGDKGRVLVIAPGGGRECNGTRWKAMKNSRVETVISWREDEEMIRKFQSGIYRLWLMTDVVFLPVWTKGGEKIIPNKENHFSGDASFSWPKLWRSMKVVIGPEFELDRNISRTEFFKETENNLLRLGDKI